MLIGGFYMENTGVRCNVRECTYNLAGTKCNLSQIEVSNEKTTAHSVENPHFCKSYKDK